MFTRVSLRDDSASSVTAAISYQEFMSRIWQSTLSALCLSDISGAWPVADEHPCTSKEIAEYCAKLLGVPVPESLPAEEAHHTRRADRRVDGAAIRKELGIKLLYPSYREGKSAA